MNDLDRDLEQVFRRAFGDDYAPGSRPARDDVPAWDSLGHIRLVLELERTFGRPVPVATIPSLHRDWDAVAGWVAACDRS